eukprot:4322974-Amphidinium_carterae.1
MGCWCSGASSRKRSSNRALFSALNEGMSMPGRQVQATKRPAADGGAQASNPASRFYSKW